MSEKSGIVTYADDTNAAILADAPVATFKGPLDGREYGIRCLRIGDEPALAEAFGCPVHEALKDIRKLNSLTLARAVNIALVTREHPGDEWKATPRDTIEKWPLGMGRFLPELLTAFFRAASVAASN